MYPCVSLGVCERGNPDEGQQEVQTATSSILGLLFIRDLC